MSLGHEEGLCEAAYLILAERAGLNPPEWTLLNAPKRSGAKQWIQKLLEVISDFRDVALDLEINSKTVSLIAEQIEARRDYIIGIIK